MTVGLISRGVSNGAVAVRWNLAVDVDTAWALLADLDRWPTWLGSPLSGRLRAGELLLVDHGGGYVCTSTVRSVEAGRCLAMTWSFPDEHETWLEISVSGGAADGTELELHHHELGNLAGAYAVGWCVHLSYFEGSAMGAPLPLSQFWNLHQTFHALATGAPPPS